MNFWKGTLVSISSFFWLTQDENLFFGQDSHWWCKWIYYKNSERKSWLHTQQFHTSKPKWNLLGGGGFSVFDKTYEGILYYKLLLLCSVRVSNWFVWRMYWKRKDLFLEIYCMQQIKEIANILQQLHQIKTAVIVLFFL